MTMAAPSPESLCQDKEYDIVMEVQAVTDGLAVCGKHRSYLLQTAFVPCLGTVTKTPANCFAIKFRLLTWPETCPFFTQSNWKLREG
jgi:hypothetical protein